jgi:outer membrane protein
MECIDMLFKTMSLKAVSATILSAVLMVQPVWSQSALPNAPTTASAQPQGLNRPDYSKGSVWWPNFTRVYKVPYVAEVNMGNSNRLEKLLRDGNLYLSLDDAIALALENNLDIEFMRYQPLIADTDILRARAGFPVRNLVTFGSISGFSTGNSATGGTGVNPIGSTTNANTITTFAGGSTIAPVGGVPVVGTNVIGGSNLPLLDPTLTTTVGWAHNSLPQSSSFVTGTSTLVTQGATTAIAYSQGFTTGTAYSLTFNSATSNSNSIRNVINPSLTNALTLNFIQPLLQGLGRSMNARYIVIARNNREASDLLFKQQVIQTVSQVQNLYWDLVGFVENVRVVQQAVQLAEKLYEDNKKQVEIGTLAPISIVQAEAEVAARQQDLTLAQTQVQQQEVILLNALSKNGIASPSVAQAHIIPTTRITVPSSEPVQPIQDLIGMALQSRPELAQARIGVTNTDIALKGTRNELLPQLNLVGAMTNNALAGEPITGSATQPSPFFVGGFGNTLGQVFSRNFPTYSVGVQLNVPLRNRAAQADMAVAQLQYRQAEIRMRQGENEVRVEVRNALIGLQQARARMEAATKSRVLEEQTVDAEQKKYALGASTIYQVIQVQRDLASAREVEVAAVNNYSKARVELDRATGQTLTKNNILLEEAYQGTVRKPADAIPATPPGQ